MLPKVHGTGNITRDPELAYGANGDARASFSIACNGRKRDAQGEWQDDGSAFLRVTLWREEAENAAEALSQGIEVTFEGELIMREFEARDGSKGMSTELRYAKVGPTMAGRQQVHARKAERQQGGGGGGGGGYRDEPRRDDRPRRDEPRREERRRPPQDDPWAAAPPAGGGRGGGDPWSGGASGGYDDEPPF